MVTALILAALQAVSPAGSTRPQCAMITPAGDVIGFTLIGDRNGREIRLAPAQGAAWPTAAIAGSRRNTGASRFSLGGGDNLALELSPRTAGSPQQSVTLLRDAGRSSELPVAYGFCESRPEVAHDVSAAPAPPAASPAFDARRWPSQDCGLLLSDGRRMRFRFSMQGPDEVELSSPGLWQQRPVRATVRWSGQVGRFSRAGGPTGIQLFAVNARRQGAKLVRISELGDSATPNATGYGICGYNIMVMGPNR